MSDSFSMMNVSRKSYAQSTTPVRPPPQSPSSVAVAASSSTPTRSAQTPTQLPAAASTIFTRGMASSSSSSVSRGARQRAAAVTPIKPPQTPSSINAGASSKQQPATSSPRRGGGSNAPSSTDFDAQHRYLLENVLAKDVASPNANNRASSPNAVVVSSVAAVASNSTSTAVARGKNAATAGMMEGWRSYTLDLEAALRALPLMGGGALGAHGDGADSKHQAPSAERIRKVFNLFESFTRASPNIETILRLFRAEFTKAIYEPLGAHNRIGGASWVNTFSKEEDEGGGEAGEKGGGATAKPSAALNSGEEGGTLSLLGVPFFDMVSLLRRERNILANELDVIEAESSVEDLKKQVLKLQSLIPFYEHEINRLTKDVSRLEDELSKTKLGADLLSQQQQMAYNALDDEFQRVTRENKELQMEVQHLRKTEDAFGSKGATTAYNQLKNSKMDTLQHMFEKGNQEATLLLLSHQLESSLNAALTEADRKYHTCSAAEMHSVRAKLIRDTTLLLEEMHAIEEQRSLLLIADPPPSDAATDLAVANNNRPLAAVRENAPAKLVAISSSAVKDEEGTPRQAAAKGKIPSPSTDLQEERRAARNAEAAVVTSIKKDEGAKAAWVANNFASLLPITRASPANTTMTGNGGANLALAVASHGSSSMVTQPNTILHNAFNKAHVDPALVFSKRVTAPLADVSSTKFMAGIEVYASQGTGESEYVQTVPYLDPTHAIQLPLKSTHVRVKFMQPMRREVRVKFGHHLPDNQGFRTYGKHKSIAAAGGAATTNADIIDTVGGVSSAAAETIPKPVCIRGNIADRTDILVWLNERIAAEEGSTKPSAAAAAVGGGQLVVAGDGSTNTIAQRQHAMSAMDGPHWHAYKDVFGSFKPFLPRLIPVEYIDLLMLKAFRALMRRVAARYDYCLDVATGKTSSMQTARMYAERLFREMYNPSDLQLALLEVIESLYVFPEQIAKVFYEVLGSLEAHSAAGQHTSVYLRCVAGITPPAEGHLLAHMMHSATLCWPGSTVTADDTLEEREVPSFLKLVYSNDDGVFTLTLDTLVTELFVGTDRVLSRNAIRDFFANGISEQTEHLLAGMRDALARKSVAIQWAELDYDDFIDVAHSRGLGGSAVNSAQYPRFLYACCVLNKAARMPPREVAFIAVLAMREQG